MKALEIIKSQQGILRLKELGGDIYIVGGCVRDHYLNKESKDIDIIVRLLDSSVIISELKKYGNVDVVGETFGVIKFKPHNWIGEPIDIAQPRVDILIDKNLGHHGIKAQFDPFITIDQDLNRRDFRLNSIAVSLSGEIIDPFKGLDDIKNKVISATSEKAFAEDPLRMLRAIQFASRFKFTISDETWKMIVDNKSDIKTISGERILEELDKIFYKGDIQLGLKLFKTSGLHSELFNSSMICDLFSNIKTREDFYFTICTNSVNYKEILKGGRKKTIDDCENTFRDIKAIEKCFEIKQDASKYELRNKLFEAIQISSSILNCGRIPFYFKDIITEFKDGKYPKSFKELAINGDELIELGYSGKEIGDKLKFILTEILQDNLDNNKKSIYERIS